MPTQTLLDSMRGLRGGVTQRLLAGCFTTRWPGVHLLNHKASSQVPRRYSQAGQDSFISARFAAALERGDIPRTFLDVGANHPTVFSNSLLFEREFGFRTIAVDPLERYGQEWATARPQAAFVALAAGSRDGMVELNVPDTMTGDDMFSYIQDAGHSHRGDVSGTTRVTVPMRRLDDLLDERGVGEIGILSLDVEGAELEVLAGMDFRRHPVTIAIVENNRTRFGDNRIRALFERAGLTYFARFWYLDDIFVDPRLLHA